ncbi:MAG: CPBP family intramembrane metalloprotease [Novibacillus thermophilus]|jgi:membrane protease YdiL (CAAX protease family)|uniref:CAAX prenyl protease 2/Lysostaphin resistance protein A-like domain-containing protein n=1 Tax=Novibacillus thermophilus TaxID=1471761 RepID=A0A1U9K9H3_9BACL|nr:CPBP family intramembrane glutamic endopeptidase [Novibacillus thermophilus]AQS56643.1 hypothetical protein B0W44_13655 [Novibacillus thermophilus]
MNRVDVEQLSHRVLVWNLYVTQLIVLGVACALLWWQGRLTVQLWNVESWTVLLVGAGTGLLIVCADLLLSRRFPLHMTDKSGINEKLFRHQPVWHILIMTLFIASAEELLFRGAIQPYLGVVGTSLLFTLIHFRYLKQWAMVASVFLVSLVLGSLVLVTHSIAASTVAHFTVDFTLGVCIRYGLIDAFIQR